MAGVACYVLNWELGMGSQDCDTGRGVCYFGTAVRIHFKIPA